MKSVGLVSNRAGILQLSDIGVVFCNDLTKRHLADLMHNKFRLFGEVLEILAVEPGDCSRKLMKRFVKIIIWIGLIVVTQGKDWIG